MNDDPNSPAARQLAKFNQLWLETCSSWPPAGFTMDTNSKLTWTITASPKPEAWAKVAKVIAEISNRWPWNVAYTVPQLHLTITGLGKSHYWSQRESDLKAVLQKALSDHKPIEINIRGLNVLRNTMVVQTIDLQDRLKTLVADLRQLIEPIDPAQDFRPGIHDEVWWTSIVRLYKPIQPELFAFVEALRDADFGSGFIESVQLMETTKGFDLSKTRILFEHELQKNKGPSRVTPT